MAERQVYFSAPTEQSADRCMESAPVIFNAAGVEYYTAPFKSGSSRKDFCLVYVINGEIDFFSKKQDISMTRGEFLVGPPHQERTYFGTSGNSLNYYWLNFTGSRVDAMIQDLGFVYNRVYKPGIHDSIIDCFKKIFEEFIVNDAYLEVRSEAALTFLLTEIMRKCNSPVQTQLKTIEYITRYYNREMSVEFLADMENMSYSYYYSVFKAATGMSPQEYITAQRINAACFYLTDGRYSVSEISERVGYKDQCYFSRVFRKRTGLSPKQYQKSYT